MKTYFLFFAFVCAAFAQPTASPLNEPKIQYFTNAGVPCSGCQIWTYQAGTTTKIATYTDSIRTASNSNPVILDAAGRSTVYLSPVSYKIVLANDTVVGSSPTNILWTVDNVSGVGGGTSPGTNGQILYNNNGTIGGFTMNGACTITPSTGTIICNFNPPGTGGVPRSVDTVVAEIALTPGSYGADPTGVANSNSAITHWLAAATGQHTRLLMPCGTYLVSTTFTIPAGSEVFAPSKGCATISVADASYLNILFVIGGDSVHIHGITINGNIVNNGMAPRTNPYLHGTTYYPSGNVSPRADGGGNDTVYFNGAVYKCILTTTGNDPPNATFWTSLGTFPSTVTNGGILFNASTVNGLEIEDNEFYGSNFGLYAVGSTRIKFNDNFCHGFGSQLGGNNGTLDCVHVGGGSSDVQMERNTFQNIFNPVTGPGNTSASFFAANQVSITNNLVIDVLNRGGGSLVGNDVFSAGTLGLNEVVTGNRMQRTTALNSDVTECIEVEAATFTVSNNTCLGFVQGISASSLGTADAGPATITGNVVYNSSNTGTNYCWALNGNGSGGVTTINILGNSCLHAAFGTYIATGITANVMVGPNEYNDVTQVMQDGTGVAQELGLQYMTSGFNYSAVLSSIGAGIQYFDKTMPLFGSTLRLGVDFFIHGQILAQNPGGAPGCIIPIVSIAGVYAPLNGSDQFCIAAGVTIGLITIDAHVKITAYGAPGSIQVSGVAHYDDGAGTNNTFGYDSLLTTNTSTWGGGSLLRLGAFATGSTSVNLTLRDVTYRTDYPSAYSL